MLTQTIGIPEDILTSIFTAPSLVNISSQDDIDIPTFFWIPQMAQASKTPVIIYVHGGPLAHESSDFDPSFVFWRESGYMVATPNVRGSTGNGKTYCNMAIGDVGGAHIEDVKSVLKYVLEMPETDPERVYLAGHSWGAYTVLAALSLPEHQDYFNAKVTASCAIAGLADFAIDLQSSEGVRREGVKKSLQTMQFGEDQNPLEDEELNQKISPVFHLNNIQTPLKIVHGTEDKNVSIENAYLLNNLIESNPTLQQLIEMKIIEGEDHYFDSPDGKREVIWNTLAFFERHCKNVD